MTPRQALAFVEKCGIVLESARGPVPNLAEKIVGAPVRGSWWGHSRANEIFACTQALRNSKDVLTCRLIRGKVTFVHRRLWPALARLSKSFRADRLGPIKEIHTNVGKHEVETGNFSRWLSRDTRRRGQELSAEEASALLKNAGLPEIKAAK